MNCELRTANRVPCAVRRLTRCGAGSTRCGGLFAWQQPVDSERPWTTVEARLGLALAPRTSPSPSPSLIKSLSPEATCALRHGLRVSLPVRLRVKAGATNSIPSPPIRCPCNTANVAHRVPPTSRGRLSSCSKEQSLRTRTSNYSPLANLKSNGGLVAASEAGWPGAGSVESY